MTVLEGAFRVGDHVFLAHNASEAHRRVVSVGARDLERWATPVADRGGWLQFARDDSRVPRFVAFVELARDEDLAASLARAGVSAELTRNFSRTDRLVFDVPDGATLAEIALRTELQHAGLDTAVAATIIARSVHGAYATPASDRAPEAPLVDASTIRVAWDGSVWFLGHLPRAPYPALGQRREALSITVDRARALIERFLGLATGAGGLLDWLRAISRGTTDDMLAENPEPWRIASSALDDVATRLGPVDDKTLAGFVQRLFPDDYARSLDARDQIAMLTDADLRAVREAGPKATP